MSLHLDPLAQIELLRQAVRTQTAALHATRLELRTHLLAIFASKIQTVLTARFPRRNFLIDFLFDTSHRREGIRVSWGHVRLDPMSVHTVLLETWHRLAPEFPHSTLGVSVAQQSASPQRTPAKHCSVAFTIAP